MTTYYLKLYAQEVAQEITWAKRREQGRKETRKKRKEAFLHDLWKEIEANSRDYRSL